ncbi:hypothetical protein ACFQX6_13275 [Streptosporangium lutulentum]
MPAVHPIDHTNPETLAAFSADGSHFGYVTYKAFEVLDLRSGRQARYPMSEIAESLALSPDGGTVAFTVQGVIRLWRAGSPSALRRRSPVTRGRYGLSRSARTAASSAPGSGRSAVPPDEFPEYVSPCAKS